MLFAILAISTYLIALHLGALAWILPLRNAENLSEAVSKVSLKYVWSAGIVACIFHFINISQYLIEQNGQNFTLVNVASLISLIMSLFATFALLKWKTIWFPLSIIYVLSLVCIAVSSFVSGSFIKHLTEDLGLLFHLSIAVFSYALFFIALLYAIQLKWLDYKLKKKTMRFSPVLPPLMTVERHFFYLTGVAQLFLTIALITGMIYLHNFFSPEHIHKAIYSFMAWIVYSILLLGQWKLHWRGNRVLIYSISGMMLLTVAYFGSRIV